MKRKEARRVFEVPTPMEMALYLTAEDDHATPQRMAATAADSRFADGLAGQQDPDVPSDGGVDVGVARGERRADVLHAGT